MTSTLRRAATIGMAVLLAAGVGLASAATAHVKLKGSHETPPVKTMASGYGVIKVAADGTVSGKGRRATRASRSSPWLRGPMGPGWCRTARSSPRTR
jgi:hypothetical protein